MEELSKLKGQGAQQQGGDQGGDNKINAVSENNPAQATF